MLPMVKYLQIVVAPTSSERIPVAFRNASPYGLCIDTSQSRP
jgi:hypothetical protein